MTIPLSPNNNNKKSSIEQINIKNKKPIQIFIVVLKPGLARQIDPGLG
jgi:hypothetical protein